MLPEHVSKELSDLQRLQAAMDLIFEVHFDQVDKGGEPYIWHLLRVGMSLLPDVDAAILGLLHDAREDTDVSENELLAALDGNRDLYLMLGTLTHDGKENYLEYVMECARYPLARKVKMADIEDNLKPARLKKAKANGHDRYHFMAKYIPALAMLRDAENGIDIWTGKE